MSYQFCKVEAEGRVLVVTLNRPEQLNALNKEAHYELAQVFDEFERDPKRWVGIITGAGKAFCAGVDLKSGPLDHTFVPSTGFAGLTHRFDRKKPLIAAVNGAALGGGFELALACDIIIAAQDARFGLTEARVGLYAAAGGIQRLIREIGLKRAQAMLLTGKQVTAEQGGHLGFVNQITATERVLELAHQWAGDI
jgi:enoyl-CoA hydratase/carnithine racemase